jgi:hypothetical protein
MAMLIRDVNYVRFKSNGQLSTFRFGRAAAEIGTRRNLQVQLAVIGNSCR